MRVIVEISTNQKGLAFVMHGLGGSKDELHIKKIAQTFKDNDYTVITFDTTNSFGESDGIYEDATTTNYYEDLEDVIDWAKNQDFYQEPFILCGHSLGGICSALYAESFPEKTKALAPISTVVSGYLSKEKYTKDELDGREKTGFKIERRSNGDTKKLKRNHFIDRLKYDLLPKASSLTMPILMIVGDGDTTTPINHQKILFDTLPEEKEFHILKNAPHTFKQEEHLDELYNIFDKRIKKL